MKSVLRSFVVALTALAAFSVSISVAHARPDRPTHEGDTGPGPANSTPGDGGGHGSWSNGSRPSRDVDHGSYDSSSDDSSSGYNSGSSGYADENGVWTYQGVACAPSDIQSNVAVTDRTLKMLTSTSEFADAAQFKSAIAQIAAVKNPAARGDAYMKLVGVDTKNSAAVMAFIGAREAKGSWIVELERNAGLNEAQAVAVATSLQNALRGELK